MVTTTVDVAPGVRGLTVGLDWLDNNVSTWNLETGKVNTYDGSFQNRVEKDVQMVRTTNRKKEPVQVLMGLPTFPVHKKCVATGPNAPQLPPELTELSPVAWNIDYITELERQQEAEECPLIPPAAWMEKRTATVGQPVTGNTVSPRTPPGGQMSPSPASSTEALIEFSPSEPEPSSPVCELTSCPMPTLLRVGSSPTVSAEVTVVPDSCPEGSSNGGEAHVEDVEPASEVQQTLAVISVTPSVTSVTSLVTPAPVQVRPVAGQEGQPSASSANESTDSEVSHNSPLEHDEIRAAQTGDDGLSAVIAYFKNGTKPSKDEVRTLPEEARELLLQWDSLLVKGEILYRRYQHLDGATRYLQLILPGKLHHEYIERLHANLGHFRETKTCDAVARRIYFPGWCPYTKLIVKTCTVCNKSQRGRQAPRQTALR